MSPVSAAVAPSSSAVVVVTSADTPDLSDDGPALIAGLTAVFGRVDVACWDDDVDWGTYAAVLVRSTWDYVERHADFCAWTRRVGPRLVNPPAMLGWNTTKTYLRDLRDAGVPIVPTVFVAPGEAAEWPATWADVVVKPAVSAGGARTGRYATRAAAIAAVTRLTEEGRTALIQPYEPGIDARGELALIYLGGRFSHAVWRDALLRDQATVATDAEWLTAAEPTEADLAAAERALAAIPAGLGVPAYARVDLVPGPEGPLLLELELTEPALFLAQAPDPVGAARALGEAVRRRL